MRTKKAAAVLSVLLYAQGLLGIAAVAATLMKAPTHVAHTAAVGGKVTLARQRAAG